MLDYRDSERVDWSTMSDYRIYVYDVMPILDGTYDIVVSHDADGEYGHVQHKRVHSIARYVASALKIPFESFRDRWDIDYTKDLVEKKKEVLPRLYPSQAYNVNQNMNFFEPK
jgi:hypothetical protein